MVEIKLGGSVSRAALEAALEELERRVEGRIADDQVEQLFGPRVARLLELGILQDALVSAYAEKAAKEDGAGLVNEMEQARLILARYDERQPKSRRKPRKAQAGSSKEQEGNDKRDATGSVILGGISSPQETDVDDTTTALGRAEGDDQQVIEGDDQSLDESAGESWPR